MKKTWAVFRVTAGDKNKERRKELSAKFHENPEDEAIGLALAAASATDPIHDFLVVAPDDGLMGEIMAAVFEKFGAKTSSDLPKPCNVRRGDCR